MSIKCILIWSKIRSFGSIPSFLLELFLHWSLVAHWAPTNLGSSSFSVPSFWLFILFMGFSRQEYWSGLPFPSPMDHILSDLSTMTCSSWVAPRALLISRRKMRFLVLQHSKCFNECTYSCAWLALHVSAYIHIHTRGYIFIFADCTVSVPFYYIWRIL